MHCIQEDWHLLRYLYEYVLAALSLRTVRRVRWQLTELLPDAHGTRNVLVQEWEMLLGGQAALWLMAKAHRGSFAILLGTPGADALTLTASDGPCAAHFDALRATQRVLLGMSLVGALLLGLCWALFPYWHDLLRDERPPRFQNRASSSRNTSTPDFPPFPRGRKVMTVSYVIGIASLAGKNLMRPALPGVFWTEALLYRCMHPHWGPTAIILCSLASFLYLNSLIALEWVGSMCPHREWDDRRWEQNASGRRS